MRIVLCDNIDQWLSVDITNNTVQWTEYSHVVSRVPTSSL